MTRHEQEKLAALKGIHAELKRMNDYTYKMAYIKHGADLNNDKFPDLGNVKKQNTIKLNFKR